MAGKLWTDEDVTALRREWDIGTPVVQIAAKLNTTEAAVTGKVHRLQLTKRQSSVIKKRTVTIDGSLVEVDVIKAVPAGKHVVPVTTLPPLASDSLVVPLPKVRLRITPGEIGECCWPLTHHRPHQFCGNQTLPGHNYCGFHAWKASEASERKTADATVQEAPAVSARQGQARRTGAECQSAAPLATNPTPMVSSNGEATNSSKEPVANTIGLEAVA
jgi:hypothetical protein